MRAVDTNILIRLVTKDDPAQAKRAQELFSRQSIFISKTETEDPLTVAQALDWMERGLDFADALHVASSQNAQAFSTFDEKLHGKSKSITAIPVELL